MTPDALGSEPTMLLLRHGLLWGDSEKAEQVTLTKEGIKIAQQLAREANPS
jgi:hypothetical protein